MNQIDLHIVEDLEEVHDERARSRAWLVSLIVHLSVMILFAFITVAPASVPTSLLLSTELFEEVEIREYTPDEFQVKTDPTDQLGASSIADDEAALSQASEIGESTDVPTPELELADDALLRSNPIKDPPTGTHLSKDRQVKGSAGFGVVGAEGAVDRITQEILLSLEQRKTLVVWHFDQSGSLTRQREAILKRFDRIYFELGVIDKSGHPAFQRDRDTMPLLTSVVAFGEKVNFPIKQPTADFDVIKKAIENIEMDESGIERVFTALQSSVTRFKKYARKDDVGEPDRNIMFIVFSDEAGDDQELLDQTAKMCNSLAVPVYIVGVPAPLGRQETQVKWVSPDKRFDQTPQWGLVTQGPESLYPERLRLHFSNSRPDAVPLDSGFGPYSLTRLAYETGGIYFAVHPNRRVGTAVRRHEVDPFSSHLRMFFDPHVMRAYRPDYVSMKEYHRRLKANAARTALIEAAKMSWVTPMQQPRTRFVKRDDASLANSLTEAQKQAAALAPAVDQLYTLLLRGEPDRKKEATPRWQAAYDLAMGRVLAVRARTHGYNEALAEVKRGKKFKKEKNNTWLLRAVDASEAGSQIAADAKKATQYLKRVIEEHRDTPWAHLAQRELKDPMGWQWRETYTNLSPPQRRNRSNPNPSPPQRRDERRRMLPKPMPKAKMPRL